MRFSNSTKRLFVKVRFLVMVVGVILWVATGNIARIGRGVISSWQPILKYPFASYDQKMAAKWGYYNLLKFVKDHTPPEAVIMHPSPEIFWLNVGYGFLLQYFLYPRGLRVGYRNTLEHDKTITHVLVAWGEGRAKDQRLYGWPKFPVNVRKFYHLPSKRQFLINGLDVVTKGSDQKSAHSKELLKNYLSDSQGEVNAHYLVKVNDHWIEYIELTYTFNSYDYWTKNVHKLLTRGTVIKVQVKANIKHSANLIAEVTYRNRKRSIFDSGPNREVDSWESLLIDDLYRRAERYGLVRGWDTKKMWISRIGVNTGLPLEMPYLEKWGIIEVEKGEKVEKDGLVSQIDNASIFLRKGNFYRAKNQMREAIANYELAALLEPWNGWVYYCLGDIYRQEGNLPGAIAQYREAIRLEPDIAWFYLALGEVYKEQNETELARENFKKVLNLDPLNGWARIGLEELDKKQTLKPRGGKIEKSVDNGDHRSRWLISGKIFVK